MKKYIVVSLFNGMGCGWIALDRASIQVSKRISSEIDKYANIVNDKNYPDTIQVGDIRLIEVVKDENNKPIGLKTEKGYVDLPGDDIILLAGSPCQGFSFAGKQLNFEDPRSKLFFEFVRIKNELNPKWFLLENVVMKKEYQRVISDNVGIEPIMIDSALVSAQRRKRLYWTNVPNVKQPEDKKIYLKDILDFNLPDCPIGLKLRQKSNSLRVGGRNSPFGSKQIWDSPFQKVSKKGSLKPCLDKSSCLTGGGHSGGNHSDMDIIHTPFATRRYSVAECEKLQTIPVGYTDYVSKTQRYKMLGNGFNVDTFAHMLKNIPTDTELE